MKRAKKSLKIPESVNLRTDNTMANIKRTNNALQNIIYTSSPRKFYGRHHDDELVNRYGTSVSQMITDMFHLS
jgi:hypothetical protein